MVVADADGRRARAARVPVPPPRPFLHTLGAGLKETLFPDDPVRAVAREAAASGGGPGARTLAALRYAFPCLGWLPSYSLAALRSDLVAGVTVASLAVPQGISYARLAGVDPSKRRPKFFWVSAAAPLVSVIFGTVLVYLIHGENHGIQTIGYVKKGINPSSAGSLLLSSAHTMLAARTGILTGIISLAEGAAVARSFAMAKNYQVDGNKEMIAFGVMNMAGSCTSCYLTAGPFSRSAVNRDAGCRTPASNAFMAVAVALTLLFLTPLFRHTPQLALSAIIASAMLGNIHLAAAARLWRVDRVDFFVCLGAFLGVVFASVEVGLCVAVAVSVLRVLLLVARPRTTALGKIPESAVYRRMDQYAMAEGTPGVLVLRIDAPIYFANASYLRERISRWMGDEEDRIKAEGDQELRCLVLDMGAVASIDMSGIKMLEELKMSLDKRSIQMALANPGSEVMRKLDSSEVLQLIGDDWIFLTVGEACDYARTTCKIGAALQIAATPDEMV
ncbi:hypothetical protein PR202_ga00271 [Eleusine coracana subsp. coracana]|uniref:STAS domain-containing protein n=1 Tax=Eleusine coracana subsp. coracana TaxID=191504 RepID=A0AAV5BFU9_ELECO|nr:hypothetical protein PR202_ga00271 [Eleusine coracana subsp. coracana]